MMFASADTCIQLHLYLLRPSETSSESLFPMTWWRRKWYSSFITVIISFSACFQLLLLTVPHMIQITANSRHRSHTIKPKQESCRWNIVSVDLRSAVNEVNGNSSCDWRLDAGSHLRPRWQRQEDETREDVAGFILGGVSTRQLWKGRKWGQRQFRESHFWNHPHQWRCISSALFIVSFYLNTSLQDSCTPGSSCYGSGGWSNCPESFCFRRSGGVFPLQIAGDFLSSPGDILLSELWLSGKTCFQWLGHFFPLDYHIWLMQAIYLI